MEDINVWKCVLRSYLTMRCADAPSLDAECLELVLATHVYVHVQPFASEYILDLEQRARSFYMCLVV